MTATVGPEIVDAALALRKSHPQAPAIDLLDLVLRNHTGRLSDFGTALRPASPFGLLVAEAIDTAMDPQDWNLAVHPNTPAKGVAALLLIWDGELLPQFAKRYGLTL